MDGDKAVQTRTWGIGIAASVLLLALAIYLIPADTPAPLPAALLEPDTALLATPDPQAEPTPAAAPAPEPEPDVASAPAPSFDTFRLDPDGSLVVAGRAAPGQAVDLMLADEVIASTTADASGSFVIFGDVAPSDQPRRLSLLADAQGAALPSQGSYLVAPIAPPAAAAPPATETAEAADVAPVVAAAPVQPVASDPATPVVVQADAQGVRVVQGAAELAAPNVVLDAITYDPQGNVQLAGRATGAGQVQIYLDDAPVAAADVLAGRDWQIDLPDVATGVYTLRIDEVDISGSVVSRLETPFRREAAANVAAVMADETAVDGFDVAIRTVQPGSTLWAIAEETLGSGILYVQVFEANSDLIRDPDLIYPGQIFRIPALAP